MLVYIGALNIDEQTLVNSISFVFQDSHLLKTSIYENIRMAKKDTTKEEVLNALHLAQWDDIIDKLPEGINSVIGSKETYLSGGGHCKSLFKKCSYYSIRCR